MTYRQLAESIEIFAKYNGGMDAKCTEMYAEYDEYGISLNTTLSPNTSLNLDLKHRKENSMTDKEIIKEQANIDISNLRMAQEQGIITEFGKGRMEALEGIVDFIDTLEVKEVDLNKEARHYLLHEHKSPLSAVFHQTDLRIEMQYHKDIENAFKAGYELGLKMKGGEE